MRRDKLTAVAASALLWLISFPTVAGDKTEFAILSICRAEQHVDGPNGSNPHISIKSGMGDGGFPIATTSPSAQRWFDYGIKLFHAFYHEDARQAFDNAAAADPGCALCLWGRALSRGPNQNFDTSDDDLKAGLDFARKALGASRTEREKVLANAMVRRYSRAQDVASERDFASDLLKAEAAGPPTPDLRLLAAEVLMTGFRRGDHTTATEAMDLVEPVLRANPNNTAAIHYYIHATEFAGKPALALAYAEKLSRLAPKASHLVHMAAHTFIHVGRYEDAATINAFALQIDAQHLTDTATPGPLSTANYYEHNLMFGMAGTLMSGDRALALKFADHLHRAFPDAAFSHDGTSAAEGKRYLIYARYDPDRLLLLPEPSVDSPMTQSLYHYARGEAYAVLHDSNGVMREAALINGDKSILAVARNVLAGRLAMSQGRFADAAKAFEDAAHQQDTLLISTMDPPVWWYPIRRSVAAAMLADGKFEQAAQEARTSLTVWPNDPIALLALSRAEEALGQAANARHDAAAALGDWEGDIAKVDINTF